MKLLIIIWVGAWGSRSPCGERGLKCAAERRRLHPRDRRSPCGERGLKSGPGLARKFRAASLPVRGAWIEIKSRRAHARKGKSLPVRGAWIEMWFESVARPRRCRRSPCGERGLKSVMADFHSFDSRSLPVRGAWIEIRKCGRARTLPRSLPVRGAWIEIARKRLQLAASSGRSPCGERGLKCSKSARNRRF